MLRQQTLEELSNIYLIDYDENNIITYVNQMRWISWVALEHLITV